LIDTQVFLWAIDAVEKLSERSREILEDRSSEIYLSRASYWEICLKIARGSLELGDGWEKTLERERRRNRFHWLEISSPHCEGIISLPAFHKDPFDRMLISQALFEGVSLISCDEKIARYDLNVIW
jgi:PIN domain nuclease of toxin-antitoxin system